MLVEPIAKKAACLQQLARTLALDNVEIEDAFKGSLFSYELNTEYRLFKNFSLGVGVARIGVDADIDDDDWKGTITDSYRGFTAFGTFYF